MRCRCARRSARTCWRARTAMETPPVRVSSDAASGRPSRPPRCAGPTDFSPQRRRDAEQSGPILSRVILSLRLCASVVKKVGWPQQNPAHPRGTLSAVHVPNMAAPGIVSSPDCPATGGRGDRCAPAWPAAVRRMTRVCLRGPRGPRACSVLKNRRPDTQSTIDWQDPGRPYNE